MSGAAPGTTVSMCRLLHNDLCFKSYGPCTYADMSLEIIVIKCEVQVVWQPNATQFRMTSCLAYPECGEYTYGVGSTVL